MVSQSTADAMGSIPVTEETRQALAKLERLRKQLENGSILHPNMKEDIDVILSVLENPVFNSILSIQESLNELKKQIVKHPSILADDFDITPATGELILNVPNVPVPNQNSASYEPSSDPDQNYDYDDKHLAKDNNSTSSEVMSPADIPPDYALATVSTDAYAEEFCKTISRGAHGRDVYTIQLFKPDGSSLGFSVVGLRNESRGELGIFIQEVQLNGIAGRDGRLHEGDQILAIDGQPLDTNISHQQAIGILQQARGLVELIVARGGCLPNATSDEADDGNAPYIDAGNDRTEVKLEDIHLQLRDTQHQPPTSSTSLVASGLERTPSTVSDASNQPASDMVLTTEWAQVESVELVNDGSGLGFGIIGGRSTGVVVKTIVPGGVADRDGRLQSGDHILQIGEVNLRGMGSEQVAAVLRHAGTDVRLIVARPVEPTSPDYNTLQSGAPIVPTRILADPEEVEKYLGMFQQTQNGYPDPSMIPYGEPVVLVDPAAIAGLNGDLAPIPGTTEYDRRFLYTATVEGQLGADGAGSVYHSAYPGEFSSGAAAPAKSPVLPVPEESEEDQRLRETLTGAVEELPEMETFEVELVKDQQGLGITIAGYVCEKEEISGIFVKSIAKGSAAHLCARIRINDQIIEVDGRPLHGYTNHQAVEVLRNTGKMVKLRLARYLRGAKYEQLQQAIATGELPTPPSSIIQAQVHEPVVEATNPSVAIEDFSAFINEDYAGTLDPKTEVAIKAKWSKIMGPDYEIVVAQISKFRETGGLGISLEGTVDVENGMEVRPHHYIRSVLKDGPVGANERLKSGDELLEVNGKILFGLDHVSVVQTLKDLPKHVRLVCARCLKPFIDDPTLPGGTFTKYSQFGGSLDFDSLEPSYVSNVEANRQNVEAFGGSLTSLLPSSDRLVKAKSDGSLAIGTSSSPPESSLSKLKSRSLEPLTGLAMWSSEPQIIDLVKGDRGLGFSILDYQDPMNPNETIIVIRSLVPGGVAQQDGRLIPGDRLLSVNDIQLENATLDAAVQALKGAARGVVRIGVAKPLPLPETQTPLEESSSTQFIPRKLSDSSSGALSTVEQRLTVDPEFISSLDIGRLAPSPSPSTERDSQSSTPMGSPALGNRWGPEVPLFPAALERQIKIRKGTDPLGLSVEMVDNGANGMVVKSLRKGGACQKDGTLTTGDYILSVNNETMKNITRSQARAILRRVELLTTDIVVKYIPVQDAAIHMTTVLLTQQQGRESPVSVFARQPSPSSPFIPSRLTESDAEDEYVQPRRVTPLASSSSISLSSSVTTIGTTPTVLTPSSLPPDSADASPFSAAVSPDAPRQFLDAAMLDRPAPVSPVQEVSQEDVTLEETSEIDDAKSFQEKRALFQAKPVKPAIAAKPVIAPRIISPTAASPKDGLKSPIGPPVQSPSPPPLPPPLPKELEELDAALSDQSEIPTTPPSTSGAPPVQFGPERCVQVFREPNRGLGISIVWGRVDLSKGNHISGIFIKNVLPESPAGRSGSLKRGDRILEVDGKDLKDATHDKAVDVIKNADNPVQFLVQSLLPVPKGNGQEAEEMKESSPDVVIAPPTLLIEPATTPDLPEQAIITPVEEQSTHTKISPPIVWAPARTPSPELIQRGINDQHRQPSVPEINNIQRPTTIPKGPMPDLVKERPGFTVTSIRSTPEPPKQFSSETEDSEDEFDDRDLQGKVYTKKGVEIDRASAGFVKLSPAERESDPEQEDSYGYTLKKVQKKYSELRGDLFIVDLMKGSNGLGLSLAGNKDRTKMSVFICGMHPRGNAFKDGRLRVADEVLEVNGVVLYGRCHLNASAMIKGLSGSSYKMILLRRDDALEDMAVKPITQFPVHFDDITNEKYSKYKGVKRVTVRKGTHGLGIMIIEGKHAEAGKGIFISDIQEVSPAEQAGLNVGDMILSVNQIDMTSADYDTAAQLLKQAEGLITLVVASPGKVTTAPPANEDDKKALDNNNIAALHADDNVDKNGEKKTSPPAPPPKPAHLSIKSPSKMPHRSSSITSPQHRVLSSPVTRSSSVSVPSSAIISPPMIPSHISHLEDNSSTTSSSQQDTTTGEHGTVATQLPVPTAADPKTSPIVPGQEVTIEITKEKMGLGLSIVGGSDTPLGTVIIHEVYPDGAAALDGRLRPGDQILEVNGEDLREAPHEAAITALRQTPSAVRMVVYREEGQNHEEDLYDVIEVALFKKQGRGLGLSIVGRKNGPGVYISEVVKGGVAEADGRLMQGDQILEVNEQDLKTATQEYAAAILKTTSGRITMKIGRLKAGSRRSVSSPKTNDIADVPLQYKTITLERGPDGLGFSIVGGAGSPHGDLPIYVKTVFDKGAAAENGQLQRGDQLVMVNDLSLEGVTHEEAVDILKNAKGTVTLTILS